MKRIIVAHPGRQHSYRLATALKKEDLLFKYITTIYDKESSWIMKITKRVLNESNLKRANGRRCSGLDDTDVVQFCEVRGLIELLLVRIDKKRTIYRWWNRKTADAFGKKVAKYAIKNNVDAVIMYDTTARKCFEILKKKAPHIKRIMDSSAANRIYTKTIFQKEINDNGITSYKDENKYMWNKRIMENLSKEINDTQYFLVASKFVKKSLLFSNVDENKIYITPYGVNIYSDEKVNKKIKKISFLFVGQVTQRKGIKYLIDAFSQVEDKDIELNIVGSICNDIEKLKYEQKYGNIKFHGVVTHDKMKKIYSDSDVFVFPSLTEGMSLASLEAMGCGLPIICTCNSGVNDLVEDEYSGFVIEARNSNAIKEKIEWFINNKDKIAKMGQNAKKVASKYTWEYYEKNIVKQIIEICNY